MKRLLIIVFLVIVGCSKDSDPVTPTPTQTVKYTLTITAGEGGSVNSNGGQYEKGTNVTLTATPNDGYLFDKWSDGNSDNPRTIKVNSDLNLNATFIQECVAIYYDIPDRSLNSYSQRFLYHHENIYEILTSVDPSHGDHVTNYGQNSVSIDYNNDGYLDFISYYSDYAVQDDRRYIKFFLNDCNNNLIPDDRNNDKFYGLTWGRKLIQGDYNGDGNIDLFLIGTGWDYPPFPGEYPVLLFSDSEGVFSENRMTEYQGTFHGGASGDLDGDGDLDLILISGADNSPILLNDGEGNFIESQIISNDNKGTSRYTVEIFDVNDDGYEDILVGGGENFDWTVDNNLESAPPILYYGPDYNDNYIFLPHLEEQFGSDIQSGNLQQNILTTLDFGFIDLNNDNKAEILILRTGNNYQEWHIQILSLVNGDYIDSTDDFIDINRGEGQPFYWMFIGDFDNDGVVELVSEWDPEIEWKYPFYHTWSLLNGKFIKSD